ncbi:MAG: hypothetical protein CM1200mP24_06410 [Gammaproteobacteria bacterium]|nr:MAG: hypothetical protein CM1200mP24_06410 [Gammaproteobacteria bacterium]
MIFRLDYVGGEPQYDGEETSDAGFFSLKEMEHMPGVQNILVGVLNKHSKPLLAGTDY